MSAYLKCMVCGGLHKNRIDKFPLTKQTLVDGKLIVEGHICRKCVIKDLKKAQKAKQEKQLHANRI